MVTVVGTLVLVYCASYFGPKEPGLGRFAGVLTAFAGSMYGLVIADDVIVLFVLWEATTVFSYLLIGHYADRKASRRAAMQAIASADSAAGELSTPTTTSVRCGAWSRITTTGQWACRLTAVTQPSVAACNASIWRRWSRPRWIPSARRLWPE